MHVGTLVSLDGSGSTDPNGYLPLSYRWSIDSKPTGSIANLPTESVVNPNFTPDVPGDYVIRLLVHDSLGVESLPNFITISTINSPPVSDAGLDQYVTRIGAAVQLGADPGLLPHAQR